MVTVSFKRSPLLYLHYALLLQVVGIKEDLNGLGPKMEEFRSVCRQLQSQLKKIPDCSETPFEIEADALVDSWLDVSI